MLSAVVPSHGSFKGVKKIVREKGREGERESMSNTPLQHAYQTLLHRNLLTPNPSQAALVTRLSQLQTLLTQPPTNDRHGPTRGLYIHGGVGTGCGTWVWPGGVGVWGGT